MISRSKATVKIVLSHRSKKSKIDGKQSIQLRIIYSRKPKYYALGYSVMEEDFHKMFNGQVRGELRELKIRLQDIEAKANNIIQNIDPFSISKFESSFFRPRNTHNNVIQYLEKEIEKAQEEGRISSRIMAECSLNSFLSFNSKGNLSFSCKKLMINYWKVILEELYSFMMIHIQELLINQILMCILSGIILI